MKKKTAKAIVQIWKDMYGRQGQPTKPTSRTLLGTPTALRSAVARYGGKTRISPLKSAQYRGYATTKAGVYVEGFKVGTSSAATIADIMFRDAIKKVPKNMGSFDMSMFWEYTPPSGNIGILAGAGGTSIDDVLQGLEELAKVLQDSKRMRIILKKAFKHTVTAVMLQRWQIALNEVASHGPKWPYAHSEFGAPEVAEEGGTDPDSISIEQVTDAAGMKGQGKPSRRGIGIRVPGMAILNMFREPVVYDDNYVGLPTFADVASFVLPSSNSPFRSVFMIIEFGTGEFAPSGLKRNYQSWDATRFKVPRQFAGVFGAIKYSWWFGSPSIAYKAKELIADAGGTSLKQLLSGMKAHETPTRTGATSYLMYDEKRQVRHWPYLLRGYFHKAMVQGQPGAFSIFKRGTVGGLGATSGPPKDIDASLWPQFYDALQACMDAIIEALNAIVRRKVPNFPGIGFVHGGGGIKGETRALMKAVAKEVATTSESKDVKRLRISLGIMAKNRARK